MAVKRTRKKSTAKKNEDELKRFKIQKIWIVKKPPLEAKKESQTKKEYKIYDAETEFRLKRNLFERKTRLL